MNTLFIIFGVVGIVLIIAVLGSMALRRRSGVLPGRRITTALHQVIFRGDEE